ncbi:cytidine deaminase [Pedobacter gandavensis]|uniref:cytidine deaminase n=1 Tax=Pedobacter TaxID=84567 RepID=UPI001C990BE4|nr:MULTISPECIES: cytidine deaminase [Pedobacter]WGQ12111.1 cytidine deaminase [Pedobacter gandavensis]
MEERNFTISYQSFKGLEALNEKDQALCLKAEEALKTSYSPYSGFKVGTAIQLKGGRVVLGSNQENVAYPSGLCAERVALFAIGSEDPNAVIESMAITAKTDNFVIEKPVTCCGGCLQVMAEFEQKQNQEIEILFYCINGEILKVKGVKNLMPFAFVESRLSV